MSKTTSLLNMSSHPQTWRDEFERASSQCRGGTTNPEANVSRAEGSSVEAHESLLGSEEGKEGPIGN
jgi:hypothetical protein